MTMGSRRTELALKRLEIMARDSGQHEMLSFDGFLEQVRKNPQGNLRNVFQLFYDLVMSSVDVGKGVYLGDPEIETLLDYDCSRLLSSGADNPFFADRIFSNRLVRLVESLKRGAQQNKIYIFDGPPGCGKSTFLNNLLHKLEEYANTPEGMRYEVVWRLEREALGDHRTYQPGPLLEKIHMLLDEASDPRRAQPNENGPAGSDQMGQAGCDLNAPVLDVPCPSHDHPILLVPKKHRWRFLQDLLDDGEFKERLFSLKEYEWVFRDNPCTICLSIFQALLEKLGSINAVLNMVWARPYHFSRRMGMGVSVFSPGDEARKPPFFMDHALERRLNDLLQESHQIHYIYSRYARTNNGVYALMDIKSNNIRRLVNLHNIVSEGLHKVDIIEESVDSLFLAVMNPEDKADIKDIQSFLDRIQYVNLPYVLDFNTEVRIFVNVFGQQIMDDFLPRVLHNFARVIIATRIEEQSEALKDWLEDPGQYSLYCDQNLQLLKMELYAGNMPRWLKNADVKKFSTTIRRKLWLESGKDGRDGLSGRDSIKIFSEFYAGAVKKDKLIDMAALRHFFTKVRKDLLEFIPEGFLDALKSMDDYTVLQQVKESLYYYNEERISKDIQNYLFALNFELGYKGLCAYTGETIEVSEEFLQNIEQKLLGSEVDASQRQGFRKDIQAAYAAQTLTDEMMVSGLSLTQTKLYQDLHGRYVHNLKAKVMDPFVINTNFRNAIKEFGSESFKTYDKKIRNDVSYMMHNLKKNYNYTFQGAKEICINIIDQELVQKYHKN